MVFAQSLIVSRWILFSGVFHKYSGDFRSSEESGVDNIAAWGLSGVTCNDLAGLFEETLCSVVRL